MDKWLKPLGGLLIIIFACSVFIRLLTSGETLSDYADSNPEIAYATPEKTPEADSEASPAALSQTPAPSSPEPVAIPTPSVFPVLAEESDESVHYEEGFFYQPLTDTVIARITGISYPVSETIAPALAQPASNVVSDEAASSLAVSYDDLRYLNVL